MATKPIKQKVEIDTGDSVADIKAVEKAAKDADAAVEKVDDSEISVDAQQALSELSTIQAEMKALGERKAVIKAELDAVGLSADVRRANDELDKIDTTITATLDVDEGGVNTTTSAMGEAFNEMGVAGADSAIGISQAFNDAAEQAKKAFGPESGIASALTALGPLGTAALGAAVGGVLYWWQQIKAEQEAAAQSVREYVGLLEDASGATEEAALQKALTEFDDPKMLNAINDLGLSWTDVADIIQGKTVPAWEEAQKVQEFLIKNGVQSREEYIKTLQEEFKVSEAVAEQMLAQAGAVRVVKGALEDEQSELRRAIGTYEAKQEIVQRTIDQVGDLKAAVESMPEEVLTALEPYLDPDALALIRSQLEEAAKVKVVPEFSGPIAPGYGINGAPLTTIKVDVVNMMPVDTVGLGRAVDRALRDYYRATGQNRPV